MPQPAEVITQWFESTPVVCHPYREPHPCLNNSIVPPRISATPSISRTRSISPGSALDHFVLPLRAWADSEPLAGVSDTNMCINAGRSQLHLPIGKPQVLIIGLVIEGREALLQRLARLRDKRPHSKGANV
jgi:hypothetical protein